MGDANFFGEAYGAKQDPLGLFNSTGALPPTSWSGGGGGPMAGPTASINAAGSALLGNVAPTSFDPSFSSEMAYLNIPHSVTKIVPVLKNIPEADEHKGYMSLAHAVSYGGLAFAIRVPEEGKRFVIDGCQSMERIGFPVEGYCNLAIVNYLLHGLQRYAKPGNMQDTCEHDRNAWQFFKSALGLPDDVLSRDATRSKHSKLRIAEYLYKHVFRVMGVVHASDKQGGQHQGNAHPVVTWPVDYVVNLVVDGKVQNLTNIWRHRDICAGDDLILRLRYTRTRDYTLVSYPKCHTAKTFPEFEGTHTGDGVWQLVPDIYDTVYRDPLSDGPVRLATENIADFDYRERGYWHVARSHAHWGSMPVRDIKGNDEGQYGNGALIQVTLAPTFVDEYMNEVDALVDTFVEPEGGSVQKRLLKIRTTMVELQAMVTQCGTLVGSLTGGGASDESKKLASYITKLKDTKIKPSYLIFNRFTARPEVRSEIAYKERRKDAKDFWSQRPELYTDMLDEFLATEDVALAEKYTVILNLINKKKDFIVKDDDDVEKVGKIIDGLLGPDSTEYQDIDALTLVIVAPFAPVGESAPGGGGGAVPGSTAPDSAHGDAGVTHSDPGVTHSDPGEAALGARAPQGGKKGAKKKEDKKEDKN